LRPKPWGHSGNATILEPLADFKNRLLVLSGLDNQQAAGLGFEVAAITALHAWLTGTHAKMTPVRPQGRFSSTRSAREGIRQIHQLSSLEVALESADVVGSCEGRL